jgi:hypothetical protein
MKSQLMGAKSHIVNAIEGRLIFTKVYTNVMQKNINDKIKTTVNEQDVMKSNQADGRKAILFTGAGA